MSTHIATEQEQWPPCCLFQDAVLGRYERADDVNGLRNIGHPDILGLSNEDIQPNRNG